MQQTIPSIPISKKTLIQNNTKGRRIEEVYTFNSSDKLGQGSYGIAYRAVHKETGLVRAIKVIQKANIKHKERLENEVRTLELMDHPHIVRLYEIFEDQQCLYIVMEFRMICSGGDIFDKILEIGNFTELDGREIFVQMVRAIYYFNQYDIVHRDLKPENFLFQTKNKLASLQMIDFGLAKKHNDSMKKLETKAGTAYYVAPEVLFGQYDRRCDIWSLGVILYVLLCGYPPFYGETEKEILLEVQKGLFQFDGSEWNEISMEAKELICYLITNIDVRYTPKQIIQHQWIKSYLQKQREANLQVAKQVFNIQTLRKWASYSVLKRIALLYLSTQLNESDCQPIKNTFLIINRSQNGLISVNEVIEFLDNENTKEVTELYQLADQNMNDLLEYFGNLIIEFLAVCLPENVYLMDNYLKLAFIFLSNGKVIDKNSLFRAICQQNQDEKAKSRDLQFLEKFLKQVNKSGELDFLRFSSMIQAK